MIPDLPYHLTPKAVSLISQMSRMLNVLSFVMDHIVSFTVPFLAFTRSSPGYALLRSIYDFETLGILVSLFILISTGIFTIFYTRMIMGVFSLIITFAVHGVALINLWTLILLQSCQFSQLKFEFFKSIKIYKCLTLMKNIYVAMCRHLGSICAHHAYSVFITTTALYYLLSQFINDKAVSMFLIGGSGSAVVISVALEKAIVTYLAMVSTNSRKYLELMSNANRGNKMKRRMIKALLSNSINFEIINTVETMRNGIGLEYFLKFVTRVTDYAIDLILAK